LTEAFDEIADTIPELISPVSDEALRGENIYIREDEWKQNRR